MIAIARIAVRVAYSRAVSGVFCSSMESFAMLSRFRNFYNLLIVYLYLCLPYLWLHSCKRKYVEEVAKMRRDFCRFLQVLRNVGNFPANAPRNYQPETRTQNTNCTSVPKQAKSDTHAEESKSRTKDIVEGWFGVRICRKIAGGAEITSVKPDLDSASEGKHYDNMQH